MLRELVAQPHCIHVYSSCKAAIKYVYTILMIMFADSERPDQTARIHRLVGKLCRMIT